MRRAVGMLALAVVLVSGSAWAGDPPRIDPELDAHADAQFQQGIDLFRAQKFDLARIHWAGVYDVTPSAKVLFNLAIAEHMAGHYVEALGHYRKYLTDGGAKAERITEIKTKWYMAAWAGCGHVKVLANDGAEILVDGVLVNKAPLREELDVTPGKHVIATKVRGTKSGEVTVGAGDVVSLDLTDPPSVVIGPGGPKPLPKTVTETYRPMAGYVVPAVLGGLGLVGIGMGVGFAVARQGAASDRDGLLTRGVCATPSTAQCTSYADRVDAVNLDTTIAIVGYSVGAFALAASVVSFLVWPKASRSIVVAPTGAGAAFGGSF